MKNMFKMMGVALLAGAMLFTACKKDEETTNTNNTPAPAIAVTFDGASWTSEEVMDYTALENELVKFDIYKDAEAEVASVQFVCKAAADTYAFANSGYYAVYFDGVELYNNPAADGSIVVSAIDPQAKTISGSITAAFGEKPLAVTLTNAKWAE